MKNKVKRTISSVFKILVIDTLWVLLLIGLSGFIADLLRESFGHKIFYIPATIFAIGLLAWLILWKIPIPYLLLGGGWMYAFLTILRKCNLLPPSWFGYWGMHEKTLMTDPESQALFFCVNAILIQLVALVVVHYLPIWWRKLNSREGSAKDLISIKLSHIWEQLPEIIFIALIWVLPHGPIADTVVLWLILTASMPLTLARVLVYSVYLLLLTTLTVTFLKSLGEILVGMLFLGILAYVFGYFSIIGVLSWIPNVTRIPAVILPAVVTIITGLLQFGVLSVFELLKNAICRRAKLTG